MRRLLLALLRAEVLSHRRDHPLKVQISDSRRAGGPAGAALRMVAVRVHWRRGRGPRVLSRRASESHVNLHAIDANLFLVYTGAAVEAAAYAPLCRRVAEEAKATVVLARPPLRFAITTPSFRKLTARHPGIKTWAVGGHSHGGGTLGAMLVADEASPEEVRGLAMLGASPMAWGRDTDLSSRRDLLVLNVMASEDEICSPKKGAVLRYGGGLVEEQFKKLPKSTRRVVIKGGNHAGFGDYGIQAYDGERTISLEDQQSQVAKYLVAFLRRVRKRK